MPHAHPPETRLEYFNAPTLAAALERIPHAPDSGIRFLGFGSDELYLTYRQMYAEARNRAAHLHGLGLRKGDRLGLMIGEAHEFLMSFLGCVVAGVIPTPLSPPMTAKAGEHFLSTAARILDNAGAAAFLTTTANRGFAEQILQETAGAPRLLISETAFADPAPAFDPPRLAPEDICFLQYTSGSTTTPRGVMVTHANLMTNIRGFMGPNGLNVGPEDVGVTWLPLYHDMGLIGLVLGPVIYIGPVVVLSTSSFARDPRVWLKAIDKYRGTITFAPNFGYAQVLKRLRDQDLEKLDLRCLRVIGCGAEPIQPVTLRNFIDRLAPAGLRAEALLPSYGLAESTLAVSMHPCETMFRTEWIDADALTRGEALAVAPGAERAQEIVSCGVAFPDHRVAIVNDDGVALPDRVVGEIVVQGASVTRGYFGDPEATAATWREGWLHTGDLGYLAGGELFVCGRKKELIIIRGANYYPQDIEAAVRDLPGVKRGNVAVFGGVNAGGGECLVVVAEAEPREGDPLRQAIRARILETMGLEAGHVVLVPAGALPRTTSGKLQRNKVRRMFEQGDLPALEPAAPASPGEE